MRLRNNKPFSRDVVLSRYFPDYHMITGPELSGLSGSSCILARGDHRLVLRHHHDTRAPEFEFRRQYRALQHLPATLAPRAIFYTPGWMAVEYLVGEIKSALPELQTLVALLHDLHQQQCLGWRVSLLPLLEKYWQQCDPARRTPFWLRCLQQLRQQGEPSPLRLAPLHMDVHAGNLVHTAAGLRLIDWEYAGDGDIALELAAIWTKDEDQRQQLCHVYAEIAHITPALLWRQVRRWRPWVLMLMAGWFECRWRQTGDKQFIKLADEIGCQLKAKKEAVWGQ